MDFEFIMIGFLLALFSAISFSLNNIFSKKMNSKIGVWNSLLIIYFFVSILSFILALVFGSFNHKFNLEIIIYIILGGVIGMIGIWALLKSFEKISVAETLAVASTFPFVSLFLFFLFEEKSVTKVQLFLMLVVFVGIIFVVKKKEKFVFNSNLIFPVITSISWGIYYFILNKLYSFNISPYNVTFYVETMIFISVLIYLLFTRNIKLKFNQSNISNGFFAGFFAMMGVILFVLAVSKINPSIVASIVSSQIIFSSIFAYFFFEEKLEKRQIIGILIVVSALVLFNLL